MANLPNVAFTDTFDQWRIKTNQIIYAYSGNTAQTRSNSLSVRTTASINVGEIIYIDVIPSQNVLDTVSSNVAGIRVVGNTFTLANATMIKVNSVAISANAWANNLASSANVYIDRVADSGNAWSNTVGSSGNSYTVAVGAAGNAWSNTVGASANAWANTIGARSNTWANTVGSSGNSYTVAVGAAGNAWSNTVGVAGNAYTVFVGSSANAWSNTVGVAGNVYTNFVGASGNAWSNTVGASANAWANTIGARSNTWANTVGTSGNAYTVAVGASGNSYTVAVGAAGNSYTVAVGVAGNTYTVAVGAAGNAWSNTVGASANAWSNTVGASSNAWSNTVGTSGNSYTVAVGVAGNNYTVAVGAAGNAWSNTIGARSNTWANTVGTSGNAYTVAVGASGNAWSNTVGSSGNAYSVAVGAAGNAYTVAVGTAGNSYAVAVGAAGNAYTVAVGSSANAYSIAVGAAGNAYTVAVGSSANAYAIAVGTAGNNYAIAVGSSANAWSNTIGARSNAWANTVGTSGNAYAQSVGSSGNTYMLAVNASGNAYTVAVGAAGNAYTVAVGAAGNSYTVAVGAASNSWANTVGTAGNNYSVSIGAASNGWANTVNSAIYAQIQNLTLNQNQVSESMVAAANGWANTIGARSNTWANTVGSSGNSYMLAVNAAGNSYTVAVGAAGNAYAISVGASSNAWANSINSHAGATFYTKSGGTISGDVTVTGNLVIAGQTTYANTQTLMVGDNIIVLNADWFGSVIPTEDAGIEVNRGLTSNAVSVLWNETLNRWTLNDGTGNYGIATNTHVESANAWAAGSIQLTAVSANTLAGRMANSANNWANTKIGAVTSNSTSRIWANNTTDASSNELVFIDLAQSGVTATTYGSATVTPVFTVDAYGRITSSANVTSIVPISSGVSGLGTGVSTALATSVGTAGAFVTNGGALGTPSSGNLGNCTFPTLNQNTTGSAGSLTTARTLTVGSTGKTFNGTADVSWTLSEIGVIGVAAAANNWANTKIAAVTSNNTTRIWANNVVDASSNELVFVDLATSGVAAGTYGGASTIPSYTVDAYGRITSASNITASIPISTGVSGLGTGVATALATAVGSAGAFVTNGGALGTPSSGTLINCTFPTLNQNTTGSAGTLTTARNINGTAFNGSADITTANWGTARTITIGDTGKSVNGSGNYTWTLSEMGVAANDATVNVGTTSIVLNRASAAQSLTGITSIDGSAAKLTTARAINGTNFDGTAAITTATWGTARTITIGSTGKSVDGSAAVSWTVAEIGAAAVGATTYVGTTAITLNRASAAQSLTGITSIDGSAASLTTARNINGTAFNGTGNITTTTWGTSRTITLGDTAKSVDGSGNYTWTHSEMGVAANDSTVNVGTTSIVLNRASAAQSLTGITSIDGSAATLTTARNINGTAFNGSAAITTATWGTARTITIGSTGKSVDGSAAVSWSLAEIGAAAVGATTYVGTTAITLNRASAAQSLTGITSIDGSAATLTTARNINGTAFNGSAAITTATWGTARTITIGSTGKSVDGSAAVSWSLAEIGAAAVGATTYVGTTAIALNRASAAQSLTGITSIDGSAVTFTSTTQNSQFNSIGVGTAGSGTAGQIRATNDITAFYSSDASLKENVKTIDNALAKIEKINGVEFDWTDAFIEAQGGEDDYFVRKHDIGVIAQEIEAVLPEVVATREDGIKAVKYDRIVPLLIEAIKELKTELDELKAK